MADWTTGEKIAVGVLVALAGAIVYEIATVKPSAAPASAPPSPSPLPAPGGVPAVYRVTTSAPAVNARSGPGASFATVSDVPAGTIVLGTGRSQAGFIEVASPVMGWIDATYLTIVPQAPVGSIPALTSVTTEPQPNPFVSVPLYEVATSGGEDLVVREGPSAQSAAIGGVKNGSRLYGTGAVQGGFVQLLDPIDANLVFGWGLGSMLKLLSPAYAGTASATA